jgi:hypothetical protein
VLRRLRVAAQVPEHVVDVRELLLEVALERLQALDELFAIRERPPEMASASAAFGSVTRAEVSSVMHQFTSFPAS